MIVIGIDPGTKVLGYAIVDRSPTPALIDAGVIKARATDAMSLRLALIQGELDRLLGEHAIEHAAVEHAFVGKGAQAAIAVGAARGIVLASLGRRRIPVQQFMVPNLRARMGLSKQATKESVAAYVGKILRIDTSTAPLDATDAMLLALGAQIVFSRAA